ncbi:hypothetical protein K490DRAFT_19782, partial [Saccharata proteae CBS 121410]
MHSIRQSCRPKHQVLILKCYPRLQKGYRDTEIKPNSSELSYLLYYASTRRSKLVKVGDFLDKRTAGDVWRARIGNVLVTLQILQALIEKCPRDIPLYATSLLNILRTVLCSNDITMVEASVPTFEALCAHQDPATLAADQEYISQYEEIVQLYAAFASKDSHINAKTPVSWPVAIRFRKAGLQAIKAIASSESLSSETGRQLGVIIPVLLLNLYSVNGAYLTQLERRESTSEEKEKEAAYKRRQSTSTLRATEPNEGDPLAASGTTEDADKLAEEEAAMVALQALRYIFTAVSRGQLRLATLSVSKFVEAHVKPQEHFGSGQTIGSWPVTLFAMICGWAPVQDRFIILITVTDVLVRSRMAEQDLDRQIVLATIVGSLLGEKINFIGLSVMDVLIGLMGHILLLLQVGSGASLVNGLDGHKASKESLAPADTPTQDVDRASTPSEARVKLLHQLKSCIANLATHIYYSDQIPDMLTAILARLKPAASSGISTTIAAIEDPVGAAEAVAASAQLRENQGSDAFFSFETVRMVALDAIKEILRVANAQGSEKEESNKKGAVGRSRVSVEVWEGTQWLLRDPVFKVRRAYADALLTWLALEMQKDDLRIAHDRTGGRLERKGTTDSLAKRAVSNASQREKSPRRQRSTFLQLLHLAVYENALHLAEQDDADILLLHLLLTQLVQKLGVNAATSGLPMVFRLQEDIQSVQSPVAKIRLGSLVHGYFWAASVAFNFEASIPGQQIKAEIMLVQEDGLKPFDGRQDLVDRIADGYTDSLYSPPSSPPSSPGRLTSLSTDFANALGLSTNQAPTQPPDILPQRVRDQLLEPWTKDAVIAATTKESTTGSSNSISGSRTTRAASQGARNGGLLAVTIPTGNVSPMPHVSPNSAGGAAAGARDHRVMLSGLNDSGIGGGGRRASTPLSATSSVRSSAVRVEDLKRVLAGEG